MYKSRCDNQYSERVSGDKREVNVFLLLVAFLIMVCRSRLAKRNQLVIQLDSLAKKYEDKYKKFGYVGSKLTIEEATFCDIQVV